MTWNLTTKVRLLSRLEGGLGRKRCTPVTFGTVMEIIGHFGGGGTITLCII